MGAPLEAGGDGEQVPGVSAPLSPQLTATMQPSTAVPLHHGSDEYFSDEVLQKAQTARRYIEHLYKVQSQNFRERRDR